MLLVDAPEATPQRWEQVRDGRLGSPAAHAGYQRARRVLEFGLVVGFEDARRGQHTQARA